MSWKPETFKTAGGSGEVARAGYTYRGLGLYICFRGSPKGRRPPTWTLTHLNSGHAICDLVGKVVAVFPIAHQIAECGDWTFEGLYGWRNMDPELLNKTTAICEQHKKICIRRGGGLHDEAVARSIALGRA